MTAADLLAELLRRDVLLEVRDGRIYVDAPEGLLTDADKARLQLREADLLDLLRAPGSPPAVLPAGHQVPVRGRCDVCGADGSATDAQGSPCWACALRRGPIPASATDVQGSFCWACALRRGPVPAYWGALRAVWKLMAAGADAGPGECGRALAEADRLIAEVGEPLATLLRHRWERDWHEETGRCPRCGELGDLHPDQPA